MAIAERGHHPLQTAAVGRKDIPLFLRAMSSLPSEERMFFVKVRDRSLGITMAPGKLASLTAGCSGSRTTVTDYGRSV
jgi:hypothetical protein